MAGSDSNNTARVIARSDFAHLFDLLSGRGYTIIGPTVASGAIIYDEIASVEELPVGYTDEQDAAGAHQVKPVWIQRRHRQVPAQDQPVLEI